MTATRWPCESCNGTGRVYRHPTSSRTAECDECQGEQWVELDEALFDPDPDPIDLSGEVDFE